MKKITLLILIAFMTITTHGQNKLLSSIDQYYEGTTWQNSAGNNYEYDSNNNLTAQTNLSWDNFDNAWKVSDKTTYTYNGSNKVTEQIYQSASSSSSKTLENTAKTTNTYAAGKLTEFVEYVWENSKWVLDYKYIVTYNANNLPSIVLIYKWDGVKWVNYERDTLAYNANNNVVSYVNEDWVDAQWVNSYKSLYTYNTNNKLILTRDADWDDFNGEWAVNGEKNEYEWDASGNKTSETDYYYSENGGLNQYKQEYNYDAFALMSSFAHPFKDKTGFDYLDEGGIPYINKLLTETGNNGTSRTVYNYNSALTLSIDAPVVAAKNIKVYPNPTVDFLNIQNESNTLMDKITVTDLTGKKVLEANKANNVDVRHLAKGMYLLEILSGESKETKKFIKE